MEFAKSDLLTKEDIISILEADLSPLNQAKIISKHLKKYVIINHNRLYLLQENITYKRVNKDMSAGDKDNDLIFLITTYFEESFEQLSIETRENLSFKYKKQFAKFRKNSGIKEYTPQLKILITNDAIQFDVYTGQIHFNNGYIDVKSKEFKQRTMGQHYVTNYMARDYTLSTQKKRNKILALLNKTITNKEDLEVMLLIFGATLSGNITKEQGSLFLIGLGSRGKSAFLNLTHKALDKYCIELKSNVFTGSETNTNKILNSFSEAPQLLYSFINELSDGRMDTTIFKLFCEGKIATVKLFKEGNHNFIHKTICIASMNEFPNFKVDTGMARRLNAYEFTSHFVDEEKLVDENKHIYLKDKNFEETIQPLLDAWVDILVEYGSQYMNGKKIKLTERFDLAKETILGSNDIFQDFIDVKLDITNNPNDKVGKKELYELFQEMFPKKFITELQVISSLKDKKLIYEPTRRDSKQLKGVFVGVKLKTEKPQRLIIEDDDEDAFNEGVIKVNQSIPQDNEEVKQLKEEIEKLKQLLADRDEVIKSLIDKVKITDTSSNTSSSHNIRDIEPVLSVRTEDIFLSKKKIKPNQKRIIPPEVSAEDNRNQFDELSKKFSLY